MLPGPGQAVPPAAGQPALRRTFSLPPNPRQETPEWAARDKSVPLFQRFRNFLGIAKPEPVEPDDHALLASPRPRRSSSIGSSLSRRFKVEKKEESASPGPARLPTVKEERHASPPQLPPPPPANGMRDVVQLVRTCAEPGCNAHFPQWVSLQEHAYEHEHRAFRCASIHCFDCFVNVFDWRRHILERHGGPDGLAHGARSDTPQYWASKAYPAGMVCRECHEYFSVDGALLNHVTNTNNPKHYAYRCYEVGCYNPRTAMRYEYVTLSGLRSHQKQKHWETYYR